jgi:cysteine-rich repeat protein
MSNLRFAHRLAAAWFTFVQGLAMLTLTRAVHAAAFDATPSSSALTAEDLARHIVSTGAQTRAQISNVRLNGSPLAAGNFTAEASLALGMTSGVVLSSGRVENLETMNSSTSKTASFDRGGDPDLSDVLGVSATFDAAALEFDFVCASSTASSISLSYLFASDEYDELAGLDPFGILLNGQHIARNANGLVQISTVNHSSQNEFYVDNDICNTSTFTCPVPFEADGHITKMTATGAIAPGINHLKLAIADDYDDTVDSWLLIAAASLQCHGSSSCGNGVVERANGEQCDDSNGSNNDCCRTNCTIPPYTFSLQAPANLALDGMPITEGTLTIESVAAYSSLPGAPLSAAVREPDNKADDVIVPLGDAIDRTMFVVPGSTEVVRIEGSVDAVVPNLPPARFVTVVGPLSCPLGGFNYDIPQQSGQQSFQIVNLGPTVVATDNVNTFSRPLEISTANPGAGSIALGPWFVSVGSPSAGHQRYGSQPAPTVVCGNGLVEPGEICDIADVYRSVAQPNLVCTGIGRPDPSCRPYRCINQCSGLFNPLPLPHWLLTWPCAIGLLLAGVLTRGRSHRRS